MVSRSQYTQPAKLNVGDTIAVIAPSRSRIKISDAAQELAKQRFEDLGLKLVFGRHIQEIDTFDSSSIASRIDDLHWAFSDDSIKGILALRGGFNSNQLLRYIDWELIKNNPKPFCGYSDITAINNALLTKTGLISYSGPNFCTFGQKHDFAYTLEYFKRCLMTDESFAIESSESWTDDDWWEDHSPLEPITNEGWLVINEGQAEGTIIGGNLCTLNLLQGTEYMPSLKDTVLFLEDDCECLPHHFDRNLQSLIHLPDFPLVKGIVIGRFQKASQTTNEMLKEIIKTKKELAHLPVIANVDFGHTAPMITFPIGGQVKMMSNETGAKLTIERHL